jgi:hypothetical protein
MKKTSILAIILVAGAMAAILSMVGDFSSYQTFASAKEKPEKKYQIIATLDTSSHAMEYDPVKDPNRFVFYAKDEAGVVQKVIFNGAKPQDFERSENLIMTGSMVGDAFMCEKILMKCPSKYDTDQVAFSSDYTSQP